MQKLLPSQIKKYFWGDDLAELNWQNHQLYIVQTLLDQGDTDAVSWLFKQVSKSRLSSFLPIIKLNPRSENFWKLYLS